MKKTKELQKSPSSEISITVKICDTFFSRFRGLMFSKELSHDQGLIFVEKAESRTNTTIHMMFVNFDITVLWLDKQMTVVDKTIAKKWTLMHAPKNPAQFIVELHASRYDDFSVGDKLVLH